MSLTPTQDVHTLSVECQSAPYASLAEPATSLESRSALEALTLAVLETCERDCQTDLDRKRLKDLAGRYIQDTVDYRWEPTQVAAERAAHYLSEVSVGNKSSTRANGAGRVRDLVTDLVTAVGRPAHGNRNVLVLRFSNESGSSGEEDGFRTHIQHRRPDETSTLPRKQGEFYMEQDQWRLLQDSLDVVSKRICSDEPSVVPDPARRGAPCLSTQSASAASKPALPSTPTIQRGSDLSKPALQSHVAALLTPIAKACQSLDDCVRDTRRHGDGVIFQWPPRVDEWVSPEKWEDRRLCKDGGCSDPLVCAAVTRVENLCESMIPSSGDMTEKGAIYGVETRIGQLLQGVQSHLIAGRSETADSTVETSAVRDDLDRFDAVLRSKIEDIKRRNPDMSSLQRGCGSKHNRPMMRYGSTTNTGTTSAGSEVESGLTKQPEQPALEEDWQSL